MFKIITGANDSYILTLLDFIRTFIHLNIQPQTLIVYDLGLNIESSPYLELLKLQTQFDFCFKKMDYSLYPDYVDLYKFNGLYCSYAFKPIIIYNEATNIKNTGNVLIWMDAANRFDLNALQQIYRLVKKNGIYTPLSSGAGSIEAIELNHPVTSDLFGLSNEEHKTRLVSISANLIGLDYSTMAGKTIISEWYEKSLLREFIMPEGSSRNNHRQDQTVLSIIIYLYEKKNKVLIDKDSIQGISFWHKKDPSTVQPGYFPFKLIDKNTGTQLAIIYSKTLEEAIDIYSKRKLMPVVLFNQYYSVSQ